MPRSAKPLPVLTDEQKRIIESYWYEDADVLLQRVWPDIPGLTRRTVHFKALRGYLATIGKDPGGTGSGPPPPKTDAPTELSTSQIEFIAASYKDANGPTELARTLWRDEKIHPGDNRVRLVIAAIRKLDPDYRKQDQEVEDVDYAPPQTTMHLAGRLNRYGIGRRPDGRKIGDGGNSPQEQRQLEALLSYMRRPVFKVEADKFTRKIDREVFEEVFLSTCWDKTDLGSEHVLQYIQLASVSAQRNQTDRMVRQLDDRFSASLEDPTIKLSKAEVDAIKEVKDKQSEHLRQINALIKTLTGERAKIVNERVAGASSMHPLVQAWKTKEGRERQLALARKYNDELKAEIGRLAGMDALKCELFGISPEMIAR